MNKIILTGGGTGGHVIPNVSLLPILRNHFEEIHYIGSHGIEKDIIKNEKNVIYHEIDAYKFDREHKIKNLLLPFKITKSTIICIKILKRIKPDILFSKGGYVSVPVCIACYCLKIPIVSHESDLTLGKANKLIYKLSTTFCTTFEKTSQNLKKAVYTGAPIRKEMFLGSKKKGQEITNFPNSTRPTILFMGGSTGAKSLNNIIFKSINKLCQKYNVIHLVGKNKGNNSPKNEYYCAIEYCNDIQHLFKLADIVVSRAGSNAIYELLALNKTMILIPLPKGNSRGDQEENAKYFEEKKYAKVLNQKDLTPDILVKEIDKTYKNLSQKTQITTKETLNGSNNIVKEILKITNKKHSK